MAEPYARLAVLRVIVIAAGRTPIASEPCPVQLINAGPTLGAQLALAVFAESRREAAVGSAPLSLRNPEASR